MFELEELRQLTYFLTKTPLAGNESVAHATLLIKIQRLIQRESPTNEQKSQ